MFNRELAKSFVVFALIGGMTVSFSACTSTGKLTSPAGKPTGGAGPVSMQQQQKQAMTQKATQEKIKMEEKIKKDKAKCEEQVKKDKMKMEEKIKKDLMKMEKKTVK